MSDDRQAVLAVNDAFFRAFEKKDIVAMEKVWSPGESCLCIHPGRDALRGWPKVREAWVQIFAHTDYIEINTEVISTQVSQDLAYLTLIENVLQIGSDTRIEAQSMATNIFERLGEHWYLVHHHGSPVMG